MEDFLIVKSRKFATSSNQISLSKVQERALNLISKKINDKDYARLESDLPELSQTTLELTESESGKELKALRDMARYDYIVSVNVSDLTESAKPSGDEYKQILSKLMELPQFQVTFLDGQTLFSGSAFPWVKCKLNDSMEFDSFSTAKIKVAGPLAIHFISDHWKGKGRGGFIAFQNSRTFFFNVSYSHRLYDLLLSVWNWNIEGPQTVAFDIQEFSYRIAPNVYRLKKNRKGEAVPKIEIFSNIKTYPVDYSLFKRKALVPAINDINNSPSCDIYLEENFQVKRVGRSISKIMITFGKKKHLANNEKIYLNADDPVDIILTKLRKDIFYSNQEDYDADRQKVIEMTTGMSPEVVQSALKKMAGKNRIKYPLAYFEKVLKNEKTNGAQTAFAFSANTAVSQEQRPKQSAIAKNQQSIRKEETDQFVVREIELLNQQIRQRYFDRFAFDKEMVDNWLAQASAYEKKTYQQEQFDGMALSFYKRFLVLENGSAHECMAINLRARREVLEHFIMNSQGTTDKDVLAFIEKVVPLLEAIDQ